MSVIPDWQRQQPVSVGSNERAQFPFTSLPLNIPSQGSLWFFFSFSGRPCLSPPSSAAPPGAPWAQLGPWLCPPCPDGFCHCASSPQSPLLSPGRTDSAEPRPPPCALGCSAEEVHSFKPRCCEFRLAPARGVKSGLILHSERGRCVCGRAVRERGLCLFVR